MAVGVIDPESVHPRRPRVRRRYEPAPPPAADQEWPKLRDQILLAVYRTPTQRITAADLAAADPSRTEQEWDDVLWWKMCQAGGVAGVGARMLLRCPRPDPDPTTGEALPQTYELGMGGWRRVRWLVATQQAGAAA